MNLRIQLFANVRLHDSFSKAVKESAESLNIKLIFLPPYSPDLNPIEFIWKNLNTDGPDFVMCPYIAVVPL